ncbi:hypothetical protein OKW33_006380 [Paraburkholderia atlantica]|uniref:Uncharacterized protein n=1 Tax=Paraburkholderia atlantica TaxID=2654982 RepID=A0A7W8QHQ0_PARAM|nr:hypothetical protein [Paraburkholderia atlantica]
MPSSPASELKVDRWRSDRILSRSAWSDLKSGQGALGSMAVATLKTPCSTTTIYWALGQAEKIVRNGHVVPGPEVFVALRGLPDEHISSLATFDNIEVPLTRLNPVNSVFLADVPPTPVGILSADTRNCLVPTLPICLPDAENPNTLRHKNPPVFMIKFDIVRSIILRNCRVTVIYLMCISAASSIA